VKGKCLWNLGADWEWGLPKAPAGRRGPSPGVPEEYPTPSGRGNGLLD